MTTTTAMARERLGLGLVLGLLGLASAAWGATAGSTPASFNVSNSGAASYRIPVQVPPGVAGMQPELVLQYDSQAGRGIAGPGWSLEGVPAIRRCPRTQMQDGVRGAVRLDANDRFCYNGQRLVMKSGQTGSYGADGLTYFTEIESFARFRSFGTSGTGPTYFTVEEKGGRKLQFGNTADSRLKSIIAGGSTPSDTVLTWYVNKVEDRNGNAVNYTYKNSNGEILLDTVSYANGKVQLKLDYVEDWNPRTMYLAGTKIQYTQLLSRITTTLIGGAKDGKDLQVKQYRLEYDFSDMKGSTKSERPVARLRSVEECASADAGAVCLPKQNFDWDYWKSADGKFKAPIKIGNPTDKSLIFSKGNGFGYEDESFIRRLADVNGDGRLDVVAFWKGAVYAYISNADGSFPASPVVVSNDFVAFDDGFNGWWDSAPNAGSGAIRPRWLIDVNGDGYPDIVGFSNYSSWKETASPGFGGWVSYWNKGLGRFDPKVAVNDRNIMAGDGHFCGLPFDEDSITWSAVGDAGAPRYFIDVDGDGFPDVLRFVDGGVYASYWSVGQGKFLNPVRVTAEFSMKDWIGNSCPTWGASKPIFVQDMNGDGFQDIVGINGDGSWVAFWDPVSKAFLKSFKAGSGVYAANIEDVVNGRSKPTNLRIADMNGDGYPDLVEFAPDGVWVALWNGLKFEDKTKWSNGADFTGGHWGDGQTWTPMFVIDMNGDGLPDVVGMDVEGVHVALSNGRDGLAKETLWTSNFKTSESPDASGNTWRENFTTPRFLQDVDGDGAPDLVGFSIEAMVWASTLRSPATRISSIQDGLGARIDIGYDLAQPFASTVYSKPSTSSVHPRKDAHGPIFVVKSVRKSDGLAGMRSWTYQYGERRADFYRGQLGFAWMITADEGTGIVTKTSFSQDYPFVGQVLSETSTKAGLTLRQVTTVPQQEVLEAAGEYAGNKRVFVYSQSLTEKRWDPLGQSLGTKTTTLEYGKTGGQQWGNLTASTVETSDAGAVRTVNTFKPVNEADWLIGQVDTSTVTSSRPARTIDPARRSDAADASPTSKAVLTSAKLQSFPGIWAGGPANEFVTVRYRNDGWANMSLTVPADAITAPLSLVSNDCVNIGYSGTCAMVFSRATNIGGRDQQQAFVAKGAGTDPESTILQWNVYTSIVRWGETNLAASLDFGPVQVGSSASRTIQLYNDGNYAVNWANKPLENVPAGFTFNTGACGRVEPKQACPVIVEFKPVAAVSYGGSGVVMQERTSAANSLTLAGAGKVPPSVAVLTSLGVQSFPDILFGAASDGKTVTLTYRNDGTAAMDLNSPTLPAPLTMQSNGCTGIAPGGSCSMVVARSSAVAGINRSESIVPIGAGTSPAAATVKWSVASVIPKWDPTLVDFGSVQVGLTNSRQVKLYNMGDVVVNWAANGQIDNLPQGYSFNTAACSAVKPGEYCLVTITFSPTQVTNYTGSTVLMRYRSATQNALALSGAGGANTSVAVLMSAADQTFPAIWAGGPPNDYLTLTYKNTGSSLMTLGTAGLMAPVYLQRNECIGIPQGWTCNIILARSTDNGQLNGSQTFVPSGAGTAPAATTLRWNVYTSVVSWEPNQVRFDGVPVGVARTATVQLRNLGNYRVNWYANSSVESSGDPLTDLTITPQANCQWVAPNTTCDVLLTFKPSSAGPRRYLNVVMRERSGNYNTLNVYGNN